MNKLIKNLSSTWLIFLLYTPAQATTQTVGNIKFARGVVAAQQPDQVPRLLGKGADIFLADNIQTSEKSFAILAFSDGGKITVRPNSSFSIREYANQGDKKKAIFDLHKGGVRASTGNIAQKHPENYKIQTKLTTIGAQQADYSVRVCQNDCAQESSELNPNQKVHKTDNVIARVVELKGQVTAKAITETTSRKLSVGGPLYTNDRIQSQKESYALLAFRDSGRMTLQANSQFDIQHYQYKQESKQDQAVYNLIMGGLRVLTGKIGKVNQQNFQVNTPVATIGIRGTGFDLLCQGEGCTDQAPEKTCDDTDKDNCRKTDKPLTDQLPGLHTHVWDSRITQTNEAGEFELAAPDANYIANQQANPRKYTELPSIFKKNISPRPDSLEIDEQSLFGTSHITGTPLGVYVTVHKGHVQVEQAPGLQEGNMETLSTRNNKEGIQTTNDEEKTHQAKQNTKVIQTVNDEEKTHQAKQNTKVIQTVNDEEKKRQANQNTKVIQTVNNKETTRQANQNKELMQTLETTESKKQAEALIHLGRNEIAYINELGEIQRLDQLQAFQMLDPYPLPIDERIEQLDIGIYSLLSDQYEVSANNDAVYQCGIE